MRTTRRPRWPLRPQLTAYSAAGVPTFESLTRLPGLGSRINAVHRARAVWLNESFLIKSSEDEFSSHVQEFYEQVLAQPLYVASLRRHAGRVRRGIEHLFYSMDSLPVRLQRCLGSGGAFAVTGLGPAFWSAVAQALDPLRLPAWTPATYAGARRLGLIQRKRVWYGDFISACDRLRQSEPLLTAAHVDHILTLVSRMTNAGLFSGAQFSDPIPGLIEEERQRYPLRQRLANHRQSVSAARTAMIVALRSDDPELAIAALESIDCRLGAQVRAWDGAALLQWIAWIWHDDDPLAEVEACERNPARASRALTAAILHLLSPERYPQWTEAAATGLARLGDSPADSYAMYVEGVAAFSQRYWLHTIEAPAILARLAHSPSPAST